MSHNLGPLIAASLACAVVLADEVPEHPAAGKLPGGVSCWSPGMKRLPGIAEQSCDFYATKPERRLTPREATPKPGKKGSAEGLNNE